jgi:EmrB/QacA subfamily drug resistance transporter
LVESPIFGKERAMTEINAIGGRSRNLVLAAMIFAVAMTFIDQTIVSIAAPQIQKHLGLTSTGVQWAINAYLMSLAALFAFGGRLADTVGHRPMVILGVIVFAFASAMCGLTPKGGLAEAWIVVFRILQGAGGAIMFPAALAIVVQTFALRERGKALALFFGIAGALTAIGPLLGGYLTQWTWRAIFWVNIPVAVIALILIVISKPTTTHESAPMDYRGAVLIAAGVALSVFGFQQSLVWGWSNPAIGLSIAAGVVILVIFGVVEVRTSSPLMKINIFRIRAFLVENLVLGIAMLVFIPVFFFASEYAQIALGDSASQAGVFLLCFFIGFVVTAQIGGRILDRSGAKRPVVVGCALAAVGFYLWAGHLTRLTFGAQSWYIVIAGAGVGFMLGPASTDAVNRASRLSYGEATGITQTVRNYAASLGLAVLGTILVSQFRSRVTTSLMAKGLSHARALAEATTISQSQGGSGNVGRIPHFLKLDFAYATRTVFYVMAGIMAVAAVVGFLGLERGIQEETGDTRAGVAV